MGAYANPGYGEINVCSPESPFESCRRVLADFQTIEPIRWPTETDYHSDNLSSLTDKPQNRPMLYSAWRRLWCSHVRFYHQDKDTFAFRVTTLFTEGYGKNMTPFEVPGLLSLRPWAEFVIDRNRVIGFGLFGIAGEEKPPTKEVDERRVQERADVWFVKVDTGKPGFCTVL